jgi:hypothetical protein
MDAEAQGEQDKDREQRCCLSQNENHCALLRVVVRRVGGILAQKSGAAASPYINVSTSKALLHDDCCSTVPSILALQSRLGEAVVFHVVQPADHVCFEDAERNHAQRHMLRGRLSVVIRDEW